MNILALSGAGDKTPEKKKHRPSPIGPEQQSFVFSIVTYDVMKAIYHDGGSLIHVLVMIAVVARHTPQQGCWAGRETLAADTGAYPAAVTRAVDWLVDHSWLDRTPVSGRKRRLDPGHRLRETYSKAQGNIISTSVQPIGQSTTVSSLASHPSVSSLASTLPDANRIQSKTNTPPPPPQRGVGMAHCAHSMEEPSRKRGVFVPDEDIYRVMKTYGSMMLPDRGMPNVSAGVVAKALGHALAQGWSIDAVCEHIRFVANRLPTYRDCPRLLDLLRGLPPRMDVDSMADEDRRLGEEWDREHGVVSN